MSPIFRSPHVFKKASRLERLPLPMALLSSVTANTGVGDGSDCSSI